MERRTFLNISSLAFGSMLVPVFGRAIAAEELLNPMPSRPRRCWPIPR
jgi:TldD protein